MGLKLRLPRCLGKLLSDLEEPLQEVLVERAGRIGRRDLVDRVRERLEIELGGTIAEDVERSSINFFNGIRSRFWRYQSFGKRCKPETDRSI